MEKRDRYWVRIGKKEAKLSIVVDNMIENPNDSTDKLLELFSEFGKVPKKI